jgi:hypothetical protein
MNQALGIPDWLPWWVQVAVLVPVVFLVLAQLAVPFSVFGVKARLEAIEARLDEIQSEIRSLTLRLPERAQHDLYEEPPEPARYRRPAPLAPRPPPSVVRPPIPPARLDEEDDAPPISRLAARRAPDPARPAPRPEERAEPRLNWPR